MKINNEVILFSIIIWTLIWLGGFFVQSFNNVMFTGLFFLLTSLLLPFIFLKVKKESLKSIGVHFKFGDIKFYSLIIVLYFFFFGIAILLGNSLLFDLPVNPSLFLQALLFSPFILLLTITQAFMEEISWAGWLFTKIKSSYYIKNLTISFIWIIWHLPFFFWTEQLVMLYPNFRIEVFVVLILHFVISRFLFNWFRAHSNNTFWAAIIHGVSNTIAFIVGSTLGSLPSQNAYLTFVLVAFTNLIFCVFLHCKYKDSPRFFEEIEQNLS